MFRGTTAHVPGNRLLPSFFTATMLWAAWAGATLSVHAAQDSLTITTNHYLVTGTTLAEIRASISRARPGGSTATNDALTTWQINWRTRVSNVNGQCQLEALTVDTAISISLPGWRPPTNASPQVVKRWLAYYTALHRHEMNHAQSGKLAAGELRRRILELPPQDDCHALQGRIQAVADEVIAEYRKRDANYDRETGHGVKEGARLP